MPQVLYIGNARSDFSYFLKDSGANHASSFQQALSMLKCATEDNAIVILSEYMIDGRSWSEVKMMIEIQGPNGFTIRDDVIHIVLESTRSILTLIVGNKPLLKTYHTKNEFELALSILLSWNMSEKFGQTHVFPPEEFGDAKPTDNANLPNHILIVNNDVPLWFSDALTNLGAISWRGDIECIKGVNKSTVFTCNRLNNDQVSLLTRNQVTVVHDDMIVGALTISDIPLKMGKMVCEDYADLFAYLLETHEGLADKLVKKENTLKDHIIIITDNADDISRIQQRFQMSIIVNNLRTAPIVAKGLFEDHLFIVKNIKRIPPTLIPGIIGNGPIIFNNVGDKYSTIRPQIYHPTSSQQDLAMSIEKYLHEISSPKIIVLTNKHDDVSFLMQSIQFGDKQDGIMHVGNSIDKCIDALQSGLATICFVVTTIPCYDEMTEIGFFRNFRNIAVFKVPSLEAFHHKTDQKYYSRENLANYISYFLRERKLYVPHSPSEEKIAKTQLMAKTFNELCEYFEEMKDISFWKSDDGPSLAQLFLDKTKGNNPYRKMIQLVFTPDISANVSKQEELRAITRIVLDEGVADKIVLWAKEMDLMRKE